MSYKQTLKRVTLLDFVKCQNQLLFRESNSSLCCEKMHAQENLPCCLEMNDKLADVSCHPVCVKLDIESFLQEAEKKTTKLPSVIVHNFTETAVIH